MEPPSPPTRAEKPTDADVKPRGPQRRSAANVSRPGETAAHELHVGSVIARRK